MSWGEPYQPGGGGGSGDVAGPASSVDNAIARYDGVTGKTIQEGTVIIGDTGDVSGVANLSLSGNVNGRNVSADGLALDAINASNTADVMLSGSPNYITLFGQIITRSLINLASHVTGMLPVANGGTGATTNQAAIDGITQVSGATDEHVLTKDTGTGNAIWKAAAGGGGGPSVTTGTANPTSTPAAEGDIYVDTTNDRIWMAKGTVSSADWVRFGHADKYRTLTRVLEIHDPKDTDILTLGYFPHPATLVRVIGVTNVGTVSFFLNKRAKLTPDVSGTNVWTTNKTATSTGLDQTSFDSGAIATSAGEWLTYVATSLGSPPAKVWLAVEYTID